MGIANNGKLYETALVKGRSPVFVQTTGAVNLPPNLPTPSPLQIPGPTILQPAWQSRTWTEVNVGIQWLEREQDDCYTSTSAVPA